MDARSRELACAPPEIDTVSLFSLLLQHGYGLLHEACDEGQADVAEYLITEHKLDVNARGGNQVI
jgi:hypothetical protein